MKLIKIEMRKALQGKPFLISLVIGVTIAVLGAVFAILQEYDIWHAWEKIINADGTMNSNPLLAVSSLFRVWIGGNVDSVYTMVFYYFLPLLAALPYSWSLRSELKSGFVKHMVLKCGRLRYYFAKFSAAFLTGAVTVFIPLVINYIIVACFVPARMPDPGDVIYHAVYRDFLFSKLFYTAPLLFDIVFMLLDALFAGVWASFVLSLAFFGLNKFVILIGSYICLLFHQYITRVIVAYRFFIELSPFDFLRAYQSGSPPNGLVVAATLLVIFGAGVVVTVVRGTHDDVF